MVVVKIFREDENVQIPEYKTEGASGFDLRSTKKLYLRGGNTIVVPTGIYVEIPPGYEIQVRSRSGMSLNEGLIVLNSPGTVDSDYRGELTVILHNVKNSSSIKTILVGDRIAQAVLCPVVKVEFKEVFYIEELGKSTRGDRGFGSTGKG